MADQPLPSMTPTPARRQGWNQSFNTASDQHKDTVQSIMGGMKEVVLNPDESDATRQGTVHLLHQCLRTSAINANINLDIFDNIAEDGTLQAQAGLITMRDASGNQFSVTRQELNQVIEATKEAGAEPAAEVAANTQATGAGNTAWMEALRKAGFVQGEGRSAQDVKFVGASDEKEAPTLIKPTIDITPELTVERMEKIQATMVTELQKMTWIGYDQHRNTHFRLHIWAIIKWVNFFTSSAFGTKGLSKINAIVSGATNLNVHGYTAQDIDKAKALSQSYYISGEERRFYSALHETLRGETTSNAYIRFKFTFEAFKVLNVFAEMVTEVSQNPQGPLRRSLLSASATGRVVGTRGQDARTEVLHALSTRMSWEDKTLAKLLARHSPTADIMQGIGRGFILLLNANMASFYSSQVASSVTIVIQVVKQVFPEITLICQIIANRLLHLLLSVDPKHSAELSNLTFPTTISGPDMIARILKVAPPSN